MDNNRSTRQAALLLLLLLLRLLVLLQGTDWVSRGVLQPNFERLYHDGTWTAGPGAAYNQLIECLFKVKIASSVTYSTLLRPAG
jgi:hypothetical protein